MERPSGRFFREHHPHDHWWGNIINSYNNYADAVEIHFLIFELIKVTETCFRQRHPVECSAYCSPWSAYRWPWPWLPTTVNCWPKLWARSLPRYARSYPSASTPWCRAITPVASLWVGASASTRYALRIDISLIVLAVPVQVRWPRCSYCLCTSPVVPPSSCCGKLTGPFSRAFTFASSRWPPLDSETSCQVGSSYCLWLLTVKIN